MSGEGEKKTTKTPIIITIVSTFITAILTFYNVYTTNQIKKLELRIESSKEQIARYKFVKQNFPDLLVDNEQKRKLTINLINLCLTEKECKKLFEGFLASTNNKLVRVAEEGLRTINDQDLLILAKNLNSPNESSRKQAYDDLKENYKGNRSAIEYTLELYKSNLIENLSKDGIFNSLKFLNESQINTWSDNQREEALMIFENLEENYRIGPKTKGLINNLKLKLFPNSET